MPPDDDNRLEAKAVRSRPRDAVLKRVVVLGVTGVGLYVVWPSLAKVFSAGPMLATVSPLWGFPIAAAEAASFVCMWALLRLALDVKPWFPIAVAQRAGNAVSRSGRGGAAAEGVAGELRDGDGEPRLHVQGQAEERPHADEARRLGGGEREAPQRADGREHGAGRKDLGEAGPHDVEAHAGDAQHHDALEDGVAWPRAHRLGLEPVVVVRRHGACAGRLRARRRRAGPPGCGTSSGGGL